MKLKFMLLLCISCTVMNARKQQSKKGWKVFNQNIVELCKQNTFFRKEVITGPYSQVVLMSVPVGEDIGEETHTVDQILVFVQGEGEAILNGVTSKVLPNHLVFVPAGTRHNFKNTGKQAWKLYTIYAPSEHEPGTAEKTKADSKD